MTLKERVHEAVHEMYEATGQLCWKTAAAPLHGIFIRHLTEAVAEENEACVLLVAQWESALCHAEAASIEQRASLVNRLKYIMRARIRQHWCEHISYAKPNSNGTPWSVVLPSGKVIPWFEYECPRCGKDRPAG